MFEPLSNKEQKKPSLSLLQDFDEKREKTPVFGLSREGGTKPPSSRILFLSGLFQWKLESPNHQGLWSFESPWICSSSGFSPPSLFRLWSVVCFLGFFVSWQENTPERSRRGQNPSYVSPAERFGESQFYHFFCSRSALFCQSMVDTRLPALLAVVLRFCRCLLRPESSPLTGTWSSRASGLSFIGSRVMTTFSPLLPCLMVFGGFVFRCCKGYASGGACGTRAVSGGALF